MNSERIDEVIERYLHERMEKGEETARRRFLAYAYLKHGGDELLEFLLKVGGMSRLYIKHLKGMENSFKWPEMAWFAVMMAVGIYGYALTSDEGSQTLGIVLASGALVHAFSLFCMITRKMREIGIRIALYHEIIQIVEKELLAAA
ncbi:MAG TPA: hypothetical protein VF799_08615 [Geobacteraceae bacterium]